MPEPITYKDGPELGVFAVKRIKGIYQRIADEENLSLAFLKAAKGKRSDPDVVRFREGLDENIAELRRQILEKDLRIGNYRFFVVRDPKVRSICAAPFWERVLHHALMNLCEPVLDAYSIADSYACRKGKGSFKAVRRAQDFSRRYEWYLKMDIRKYFDSIDHAIALRMYERKFKDKELLRLFRSLLDTYHTEQGRGLPIGNLFSQHTANFYLGALDHWLKEENGIKGYVRYMDDFIIWHDEKEFLKMMSRKVRSWLHDNLRLELKEGTQLNRSARGIGFLGFRVFPDRILLSQKSRRRFVGRLRASEVKWREGSWSEAELVRHVEPLVAFTAQASAHGFRSKIIDSFGVSF